MATEVVLAATPMDQLIQRINDTIADAKGCCTEVDFQRDTLMNAFQGQAAQEFSRSMSDWIQGATEVNRMLNDILVALQGHATIQAQTITTTITTASWTPGPVG